MLLIDLRDEAYIGWVLWIPFFFFFFKINWDSLKESKQSCKTSLEVGQANSLLVTQTAINAERKFLFNNFNYQLDRWRRHRNTGICLMAFFLSLFLSLSKTPSCN